MDISLLVHEAKQGDKEALLRLILLRQSEYYKLAYVYLKNQDDTMDALEEMIVILYNKLQSLKNNDSFYSWSKTILVNICKEILRKRKRLVLIDKQDEQTFIEKYENKESNIDLEQCMRHLNEYQQETIRLRYYLDLDYKTIAEVTKVPEGTVKSRISTGLTKLKALLGGDYLSG